jgi:uncharacterized phage infection (PIP) family protein YhgE
MTRGGKADLLWLVLHYKRRNADGMLFPPQSSAEHRVWNDLRLALRHMRGEKMDLGDVLVALHTTADELREAGMETAGTATMTESEVHLAADLAADKAGEVAAHVVAARQRVEGALQTLLAATGGEASIPATISEAYTSATQAITDLNEKTTSFRELQEAIQQARGVLTGIKIELDNTAMSLESAADAISEYAGLLN